MAGQAQAAAHWDDAYAQGEDTRSWFEQHPDMSLRMLDSASVWVADALIDAGGGASPLTKALLDRGFCDLTVLDISAGGCGRSPTCTGIPRVSPARAARRDLVTSHLPEDRNPRGSQNRYCKPSDLRTSEPRRRCGHAFGMIKLPGREWWRLLDGTAVA
jgi:hypothetical protein